METGKPEDVSSGSREYPVTCDNYKDDKITSVPAAVVVRNATKRFGIRAEPVIKGLNMTIPQGSIYSLIGGSGCGKSTTLSCIVGLSKFTSGDVWIFGAKPRTKGLGIPGRAVGYMPQDISLYNRFTILETFTYFGMLTGMSQFEIMMAIVYYSKLLELPIGSRYLGTLSGGQRRRISIAISLMHCPKLTVLDEPTVGVDALLRESIWNHLAELTREKGTTVIITTHYIEETRRSDTIAIMRNGLLIAEDAPSALMEMHTTGSLETVILNLVRNATESPSSTCLPSALPQMASIRAQPSKISDSITRVRALIKKNTIVLTRSLTLLLMMIIVPSFSMYTMFLAEGGNPHDLRMGVVNGEFSNVSSQLPSCHNVESKWLEDCQVEYFSCKFLHGFSSDQFILIEYRTIEEAEDSVRQGHTWGFIEFPPDYSWQFYERAVMGADANPEEFNKSNIIVRLDHTNDIIARQISTRLYTAYQNFLKQLLKNCGYDPKQADYVLHFRDPPLLGVNVDSFRDYVIPGGFPALMFFWPIISAGITFVSEKREGTMERSLVAGVHTWEIFFAFLITETLIGLLRMAIVYAMTVWIFTLHIEGSLLLSFLLGLLTTYMGVAAGFLFGSFCTSEIQVALLALAVFMPNMVLSGICWPIEGMPVILQKIAYVLPCTLASESMRSIIARGWEFSHPNVWPGFACSFAYMMVYFVIAYTIASVKFIK